MLTSYDRKSTFCFCEIGKEIPLAHAKCYTKFEQGAEERGSQ
jgi:hypothetical protein